MNRPPRAPVLCSDRSLAFESALTHERRRDTAPASRIGRLQIVAEPRKDGLYGTFFHAYDLEPMVLVRIAFQNDFGSSVAINIDQVDELPRCALRHVSVCFGGPHFTDNREV